MRPDLEYYRQMRRGIPVFTLLLFALFAISAGAQANGVPPSVTSFGFGGQPGFHGTPPSVTSLGPQGATPQHPVRSHPFPQQGGMHPGRQGQGHQGHHHEGQDNTYPYYVPYYVPYYPMDYTGPVADDASAEQQDVPDQYEGGPTIFDRRGSGARAGNDYAPERAPAAVPRPTAPPAPTSKPVDAVAADAKDNYPLSSPPNPAEPPIAVSSTILIFKDGHKQQIGNYAIVGANLYDLTPGRRQKVALADLDLDATQKVNDDQGNDFKLPQLPGN